MIGNKTNLSCSVNSLGREQMIYFNNYAWWIETIGNLCCGCTGIFLNSITIYVFSFVTNWCKTNFFHRLLICLAIFDTLYISCEISEVFRHRYNTFLQQTIFVNFVYPIRNIFMFSSVYMTVVLALERYQAIRSPINYKLKSTLTGMNWQLYTHVVPGVVFAVIYYLPKFFELDVEEKYECSYFVNATMIYTNDTAEESMNMGGKEVCTFKYYLIPTNLRRNHLYVLFYIVLANLILTAILPLGVLTFLNLKIKSSLKKFMKNEHELKNRKVSIAIDSNFSNNGKSTSNSNTDRNKTFVLFSISILFAISHSLRVVLNIDEFVYLMAKLTNNQICTSSRIWTKYVGPFNQLFIILNSSLNFFIYVFFDSRFQQVLRKIVKTKSDSSTCQIEDTERSKFVNDTITIAKFPMELSSVDKNLR